MRHFAYLNDQVRGYLYIQAFNQNGDLINNMERIYAMLKYTNPSDYAEDWFDFLNIGLNYMKKKDLNAYNDYSVF